MGGGHHLHQGAAHDGAIGPPVAHLPGLLGAGNAKTHGHRCGALALELTHQVPHPGIQVGAHPGNAGHTHEVGEAAAGGMNPGHAFGWGGGSHQQHQIQPMASGDLGELFAFLQGEVGHHQSGGAGRGGIAAEGVHAPVEQGVAVGEQHHRHGELAFEAGEHLQHLCGGGGGGEGAACGGLDHRTIRQGIAVGNAELHHVGPMGLEGEQGGAGGGQIRIAGHQEWHQGAAALLAQIAEALLNRGGNGRHSAHWGSRRGEPMRRSLG